MEWNSSHSHIVLRSCSHLTKSISAVLVHKTLGWFAMGQNKSKGVFYPPPEQRLLLRKRAGSVSSLARYTSTTTKKSEKRGTLRRSRSNQELAEFEEKQRALYERVEREAAAMEEWVAAWPGKKFQVPLLHELASVAVARCLNSAMDVERVPQSRKLKEAVEFAMSPTFDEEMAMAEVNFSNGGRTIRYNGKGYTTTVMKTPFGAGLSRGRHAWIVLIENSRVQGWVQIGVVNEDRYRSGCRTEWDGNPHPFRLGELARRSNGNFHSGKCANEATMMRESIYLGGYQTGDTIGVKVDFDRKEIQWTRNGEEYGSTIHFDANVLYPSVSLDSPGEAVSLLFYISNLTATSKETHSTNGKIMTK